MSITVFRAVEFWQRACVSSVRIDVCIKELSIDPKVEFDQYDSNEAKYILVMDGKLPVGTCRLRFLENEGIAKIERVNVIQAYRRSGIGRKLIAAAEDWALAEGYHDVTITAREEAIRFYEKNGYIAHPDRKFQSTVFVVIPMTKRI